MRDGSASIAIKVGGAGLSYVLLVVVARTTNGEQYGMFGAAWTAFIVASVIAIIGQNAVITRIWPALEAMGDRSGANAHLRISLLAAGFGLILAALGFVALAYFGNGSGVTSWSAVWLAAGLATIANGWAEVMSGILRSKGDLLRALLPRDVLWRTISISIFLALWMVHREIAAAQALIICAVVLVGLVGGQTFRVLRGIYMEGVRALGPGEVRFHRRVTWGLWGVNSLPLVMAQANTLIVAYTLGPIWAGVYFAADRTSQLFGLATNGINQVLAPELSANFDQERRERVQQIVGTAVALGSLLAVAFLLAIGFYGQAILAVFDLSYASPEAFWVLLVLSVSQAVSAFCGPSNILLQMTGRQNGFFLLAIISGIAGLLLTIALVPLFGAFGAAMGSALANVTLAVGTVIYARRSMGIDPSILALVRPSRSLAAGAD